jgi:hypothetical protein
VVDVFADRHLCRQRRQATEVIAMPVRDDQMIDLRDARVFHGFDDAARVTLRRLRAEVARIHQQRLARRRDEQRRVAALHVDHVNIQRLPPLRESERSQNRKHSK